jgi:glycosyl transferase family 87
MRINSWRGMLFAGAVALLAIYFVWWGRMIADPVARSGADFIAFYSAGRVAQAHGFTSIYEIDQQQKIEQEVVGFPLAEGQVLLYNHMPYLVPLLALVVSDNYVGSFERWVLVLISIYLIGTRFLIQSLFAAEKTELRFALLIVTLTFSPLFISLWQGQDTAFLYLGVLFWCIGILKKQDWLIAVGLALATVRPHISLALAVPLLFSYQRAWWRSLLVISLLAIFSVMILNVQGTLGFVNLLRISSEGVWFGMKPAAMLNLLGLLLRVVQFPSPGVASWIGWLIYLAGIVLISALWQRSKIMDGRLLGLSILIALVTAPHLHLHDLTLLIFPLLFVAQDRMVRLSEPRWVMIPLGASLFLLIGILLDVVYYILPYLLFVVLAWLLITSGKSLQSIPRLSTQQ